MTDPDPVDKAIETTRKINDDYDRAMMIFGVWFIATAIVVTAAGLGLYAVFGWHFTQNQSSIYGGSMGIVGLLVGMGMGWWMQGRHYKKLGL